MTDNEKIDEVFWPGSCQRLSKIGVDLSGAVCGLSEGLGLSPGKEAEILGM